MFTKKIIALFLIASLYGFFPQRTVSAELEITPPITKEYVQQQIDHFSELNGVDPKLITRMVECESHGSSKALGDGGRAFGILQYHKATFERHAKELGENLDYYSVYDQIKLGTWAIANGKATEWSSYVAIQQGGTYAFYSKLLKGNYVVVCK